MSISRCPGCGLEDGDGHICYDSLRRALRSMIVTCGQVGVCAFCSGTIYWIKRPGKLSTVPYDGEGTRHSATCAEQGKQRRPHTSGMVQS